MLDLTRSAVVGPVVLGELSRQLRRIIPFAAAMWCGSDPLTTLAISPARLENVGGQCERFWEREFLIPDLNLFRDLARADRPVASLYRATGGQPARSVRYREFRRDLGFGDELRGVFRSGGGAWGYVALWRQEGERPFSAAEEKLVADLSTPIAEIFRRAALLRASASGADAEAPGLLVLAADGTITSFTDQAERWLRELPAPMACDAAGFPAPIPTEVRSVVAYARAIAAGSEQGAARARIQSRGGRWLVIHGFPLRGAAAAAGSIAVVIEPAKAAEIAPIIVEAYDLSPREQQITQLIARGLSTAQIAQQLFLSPHTVRDYVKSVFAKVGVASRGELAARLFAEHYQAPLRDAILHAPQTPSAG